MILVSSTMSKFATLFISLFSSLSFLHCSSVDIKISTIWKQGHYSAFTSLVYHNNSFYCAFRDASAHRANISDTLSFGKIYIIKSKDAINWKVSSIIEKDSCDLRDPNLSISPNGQMMLLYYCRSYYSVGELIRSSFVVFYNEDGYLLTSPTKISINDKSISENWLWKVKWHKGRAYGFAHTDQLILLSSADGIHYDVLYKGDPFDEPSSEGCINFIGKKMVATVRGKEERGSYGVADFPYTKWTWERMNIGLGGPEFVFVPTVGKFLLGTRNYQEDLGKTSLYWLKNGETEKIKTIDDLSDSSYPSFVQVGDTIYMSYYAGKNGESDIKLARITIYN